MITLSTRSVCCGGNPFWCAVFFLFFLKKKYCVCFIGFFNNVSTAFQHCFKKHSPYQSQQTQSFNSQGDRFRDLAVTSDESFGDDAAAFVRYTLALSLHDALTGRRKWVAGVVLCDAASQRYFALRLTLRAIVGDVEALAELRRPLNVYSQRFVPMSLRNVFDAPLPRIMGHALSSAFQLLPTITAVLSMPSTQQHRSALAEYCRLWIDVLQVFKSWRVVSE